MASGKGPIGRALDWLDHRAGYRSLLRAALEEQVLGGASFAYVFGSILTLLLLLQLTTGLFLAMYYSPSSSDAWASVAYIQDQVTLGWFVRGLHSHGASAMVIVAGLHLLQTAIWGAYKKPRELNWVLGVFLLGLIMAFALTGYLLPWDQTGYWATKVATGIGGSTPFVGDELQQLVQGGNEYGNLTLTRFFAIHVFILPGAAILLVVGHIHLFRRHGVTPKWRQSPAELKAKAAPFWPDQMFLDMVAIALTFAALVLITVATRGVELNAPADPSSAFDARPEWYFRALFQALKYFEGSMEQVVALGMPLVAGAVLLGIPFLDRRLDRSPSARKRYLAVLGMGGAVVVALTVISAVEDAIDPDFQDSMAKAEKRGEKARHLARTYGVPPAGGTAVYTMEPRYLARKLWAEHCASCHEGKERKAPIVSYGYNSRQWIRDFFRDPDGDRFFGRVETVAASKSRMQPVKARGEELDALVEFVYSQSGAVDANAALAARGAAFFDGGVDECVNCHEVDGREESEPGPNLGGRGSAEMLAAFIANPGDPRWFGKLNDMPSFADKLGGGERRALAENIVWLRSATPEDEEEHQAGEGGP